MTAFLRDVILSAAKGLARMRSTTHLISGGTGLCTCQNPSTQGSVLIWRATLCRGRMEQTDARERVPPKGKLGHYPTQAGTPVPPTAYGTISRFFASLRVTNSGQ
jgi:hypothetical protein